MHDAAAGGHELQVAWANGAFVPGKIFVVDATGEQVGDCFLAAVGVVRETCAAADGEVIQHEEGAEVAQFGGADGPADARAGAFGFFDGQEDLTDCAGDGHIGEGEDDRLGMCEGRDGGGGDDVVPSQVLR